jgi:cytochrome b561
MLRNTTKRFGGVTKLVHWLVFILITAQFYLVWDLNDSNKALYMMLHKSIGVTILLLGIFFIIWHSINIKPLPAETQPRWQYITSKIVHHTLFLLLLVMPIIGYLLSCTNGRSVNFFGWFTIPCLIAENDPLSDILFNTHVYLGYVILTLVGIHILAALYHGFVVRDNVLKRMLPFTNKD